MRTLSTGHGEPVTEEHTWQGLPEPGAARAVEWRWALAQLAAVLLVAAAGVAWLSA